MDSKLRDKIAEALAVQGVTDGYICDKTKAIADSILSLLARELADAEKWRVLEKKYPNFCKRFDVTIDALEGEGEKG